MNTALDFQSPDEIGMLIVFGLIAVWALFVVLRSPR
jgi:hypothetical protein